MSFKYPVGNKELLKGCQQKSDKNKYVVKRFICLVELRREMGSCHSYPGEPKFMVMGMEKSGWMELRYSKK